ncbi:hypothetical protein L1887_14625 [Cichorium endivia]|nr:hypothetical protein L1887_14625 [Cichorium endivia]
MIMKWWLLYPCRRFIHSVRRSRREQGDQRRWMGRKGEIDGVNLERRRSDGWERIDGVKLERRRRDGWEPRGLRWCKVGTSRCNSTVGLEMAGCAEGARKEDART